MKIAVLVLAMLACACKKKDPPPPRDEVAEQVIDGVKVRAVPESDGSVTYYRADETGANRSYVVCATGTCTRKVGHCPQCDKGVNACPCTDLPRCSSKCHGRFDPGTMVSLKAQLSGQPASSGLPGSAAQ